MRRYRAESRTWTGARPERPTTWLPNAFCALRGSPQATRGERHAGVAREDRSGHLLIDTLTRWLGFICRSLRNDHSGGVVERAQVSWSFGVLPGKSTSWGLPTTSTRPPPSPPPSPPLSRSPRRAGDVVRARRAGSDRGGCPLCGSYLQRPPADVDPPCVFPPLRRRRHPRKSPDDRDTRSGMRVAHPLLNVTTRGSQGWKPQGGEP